MEKWMEMNETVRKEKEKKGVAAWRVWADSNEKIIKDLGGPLGKT